MEVAYQTYEKAIKLAKENRNFDIIPSLYYNFAQFTFAVSLLELCCHVFHIFIAFLFIYLFLSWLGLLF